MRRLVCVVALLFVCLSLRGFAQTSTLPCSANCVLAKNQPFNVAYYWAPTVTNPDPADGFKLYQNGVVVAQAGIAQLVNGWIIFPFSSGLATSATYTFNVSAYNSGGETMSDPIVVTIAKGKPAKPLNGRIQ